MKRIGGPSYRLCGPPPHGHSIQKTAQGRQYVATPVTEEQLLATGRMWQRCSDTERFALVILATGHVQGQYTAHLASEPWDRLNIEAQKMLARGVHRFAALLQNR
jgi:hypothetical protein